MFSERVIRTTADGSAQPTTSRRIRPAPPALASVICSNVLGLPEYTELFDAPHDPEKAEQHSDEQHQIHENQAQHAEQYEADRQAEQRCASNLSLRTAGCAIRSAPNAASDAAATLRTKIPGDHLWSGYFLCRRWTLAWWCSG